MKNQKLIVPLLLSGIFFLSACKKNKEPVISNDEAADVVETTVSTKDAGVSDDYTEMSKIVVEDYALYQSNCSYTDDTSYSVTQNTGVRTYDMDMTLSWTVDCTGGQANSVIFDYNKTGTYNGPRLTRTGKSSGQLTFTNIAPTETYLIANGTLTANGTSDFSVQGTDKSLSTVTTFTLSNLHVDKTTYEITEGTATVNLEATGEDDSLTLTGSVTFLGSGQATITINGTSYTIDIYG